MDLKWIRNGPEMLSRRCCCWNGFEMDLKWTSSDLKWI